MRRRRQAAIGLALVALIGGPLAGGYAAGLERGEQQHATELEAAQARTAELVDERRELQTAVWRADALLAEVDPLLEECGAAFEASE